MLQLIGRPAFSAFRLEKLLNSIQAEVPVVMAVRTEFRYFIEIDDECILPSAEHQILETLLEATEGQPSMRLVKSVGPCQESTGRKRPSILIIPPFENGSFG